MQALFGIIRGADVEGLRRERGAQGAGDLRLVVDHQNSAGHLKSFFLGKITLSAIAAMMQSKTGDGKAVKATIGHLNWRQVLGVTTATAGVAMVTLLLSVARVNQTAAGLVFLTTVVWFATRAGLRRSLYVALLCAVSFDYFFLLPLHTLRLAGPQEWVEMLSFAVSCVIVGRLAERARTPDPQCRTAARRCGAPLHAEPGDDAARRCVRA